MGNYQKMYAILCAAASDAIDLIAAGEQERAAVLLQNALDTAEERYLSDTEDS